MPDHEHHGHHHVDPEAGDLRMGFAVAANLALTVAQVIGGALSGSIALVADALHNLSDAMSLAIAFFARRIARRHADATMSYGYARAEIIAAMINYTTLIVLGLFLVYEAIMRFFAPEPVAGWIVVIIAAIALAIDVATALLTYAMSKTSVNIRAAFLHNVADALGSVAVIVAGTLIILFGWTWVDPLITLAIAAYVIWQAGSEISAVIRTLMMATPDGLLRETVVGRLEGLTGVQSVHHVHVWQIDEARTALSGHVVIEAAGLSEASAIVRTAKSMLDRDFGICHATLEIETAASGCADTDNRRPKNA